MTDATCYLEMLATAPIREEWAKTLKEGDEVVLRTSWMSTRNGATHKIKKITKTGRIRLENGVLFGSDAMRVERGWGLMVLEAHP